MNFPRAYILCRARVLRVILLAERQRNISFIDLGKEVKRYIDSGSFVPDDTMISLISKEIESVRDQNWLLDGKLVQEINARTTAK